MVNGFDDCLAIWSQRKGVASAVLQHRKIRIMLLIGYKITTLKSRLTNYSKGKARLPTKKKCKAFTELNSRPICCHTYSTKVLNNLVQVGMNRRNLLKHTNVIILLTKNL